MQKKSIKTLSSTGWIPNYHGAWVMITLPIILGIVYGGFHWLHTLLLVCWFLGYFAFFATSAWLHSRRNDKCFLAMQTYCLLLIAPSAGLLICAPYLMKWLIFYAPLIIIAIIAVMQHQERNLFNNLVTIGITCLMLPVAYDLSISGANFSMTSNSGIWGSVWSANNLTTNHALNVSDSCWKIWQITGLVCAYLAGTVLYVKTNLRERKSDGYLVLSVVFHVLFSGVAFVLAQRGVINDWHVLAWIALTLRSLCVPLYGRHKHALSPKQIGIGEFPLSVCIFLSLL